VTQNADLANAKVTIRRIDISIKDSDDLRAPVFWFARRADLRRVGPEAVERIAAIAAALYTPDGVKGTPDPFARHHRRPGRRDGPDDAGGKPHRLHPP
jgi:hypothetical protein